MLKIPPNPFEPIVQPFRGFARKLVSPEVVETVKHAVEAVKDMATALGTASVDAETNSAPPEPIPPAPEPEDEGHEAAPDAPPAETHKRKGRRGKKGEQ